MEPENYLVLLREITAHFEKNDIDCAVIGAFALMAHGYVRATRDLDFIVRLEDHQKVINFMESLGFETLYRSRGYSNHWHSVAGLQMDYVYVSGKTATEIFGAAESTPFCNGAFSCPVAAPEHLMALKLCAITNDPGRKLRDLADIREIVQRCGLEHRVILKYLQRYGLEEYYDDIIS